MEQYFKSGNRLSNSFRKQQRKRYRIRAVIASQTLRQSKYADLRYSVLYLCIMSMAISICTENIFLGCPTVHTV